MQQFPHVKAHLFDKVMVMSPDNIFLLTGTLYRLDENAQHCSAVFLSAEYEELARNKEEEILNH